MELLLDRLDVLHRHALVDDGGVEDGLSQGAGLELVDRDTASSRAENLIVIRVELTQAPLWRSVGAGEEWDSALSDEGDVTITRSHAAEGTLVVGVWVDVKPAKVISFDT